MNRRDVLCGAAGIAGAAWWPAWARPVSAGLPVAAGDEIVLRIARQGLTIDGRATRAIGINGSVPAPLIRLREGQVARIHVDNALDVESSLHWHGLLVPAHVDGVPGISFPGIAPGARWTVEFSVRQAGTYWYHSHSAFQEQEGLYGPIVIDPAGAEQAPAAREHVILLSDHGAIPPAALFRRMKLGESYWDFQKQTLAGLLKGRDQPLKERLAWGAMRMSPTDIADATGAAYTYLVNGHGPRDNWTGLFEPGERVRLRVVNASSMTTFNVRIPGLPLTIVAADGQDVRPVEVDEVQIGPAETYDAIVAPADRAYTVVGESIDRSGMARATLAPRPGMAAPVPALRPRPIATMADMGMGGMATGTGRPVDPTAERNSSATLATAATPDAAAAMDQAAMSHAAMGHAMDHGAMGHGPIGQAAMGDAAMDHAAMSHAAMDHAAMGHGSGAMRDFANAPGVDRNPGVQTISPMPVDRTGFPGQGLADVGHRVLTYRLLAALAPNPDVRAPSRALTIHLTGNMERFMWSFDGVKMSDMHAPIPFRLGERVRVTLVNDTMMGHPIHLHGHFFELVTGHGDHAPRKHTVMVQPGGTVTWDVTTDAEGDWAFHCHMLYHMQAGMMRTVSVRRDAGAAA